LRRRWYHRYKDKGLRAKVLVRDDHAIVGLCQYLPIEHSPLIGEQLLTILCIVVHGYEHLVGNQQGKGYGRFMLNCIEEDARASGAKGIAVRSEYSPEWEAQWNTVSFYEHMGYSPLETCGPFVLVWKPFVKDAQPPSMLHPRPSPSKETEKTRVTVFTNGWCGVDCSCCIKARDSVAGIEKLVAYEEIDTSDRANMLSYGIDEAVLLNDAPFRPWGTPWTSGELRAEILLLSKRENTGGDQTNTEGE
jgi:GNAT superfamily N-acetyltransferase